MKSVFEKLQSALGSNIVAPNREDWYVAQGYASADLNLDERFDSFVNAIQKADEKRAPWFDGIQLQHQIIDVVLANQNQCKTEVVSLGLDLKHKNETLSGFGKHVVYFTGMDTRYQNCFQDLTTAVKVTGAQYYAFEYPGMKALGGEVLEENDMVNAGIAVVNALLNQGIALDDILFQGDSFGAAIAYKVKQQFLEQSGVKIRVIMNNTFSSFEGGICDMIGNNWYTYPITMAVGPLLKYTGWDARPGDTYVADTAYQIHITHVGDLTLPNSSLALKVAANERSIDFIDPCEEEYKINRDKLKIYNWATITPDGAKDIGDRYGLNEQGLPNTHFADLSQMYYPETKEGSYEGAVVSYLQASNDYVAKHPQKIDLSQLPLPLLSGARALDLRSAASSVYGFFSSVLPSANDTSIQEINELGL